MSDKRYKVERNLPGEKSYRTWSVGYPTKKAARAAARRLNQERPVCRFRAAVMDPEDYAILASMEAESEV